MTNAVGCTVRVVDSYSGVALPYTRSAMLMFPSSPHHCAGVVVDRESQGGRHTGSCVPVKVSMGGNLTPEWSQHRTQNSVASVQYTHVPSRRPRSLISLPAVPPTCLRSRRCQREGDSEWHSTALFLSLSVFLRLPSCSPVPIPPHCAPTYTHAPKRPHTMPVALAASPPPPYRPKYLLIRSWPSVSTRSPT